MSTCTQGKEIPQLQEQYTQAVGASNPFAVSYADVIFVCVDHFFPQSVPSSSQGGGTGGISFQKEQQQPHLKGRDLYSPQISTRNPFAVHHHIISWCHSDGICFLSFLIQSNNPADGGAFHSDWVAFPDQWHSFVEGGISQQPQYSTKNPLVCQKS